MGALLSFPVAAVQVSFDDGWAARKGQMKTRGDGKEKTRKLWNKHAKIIGQDRLLAALKRYLREEKEPTCGYPGLSVWLNGERYDHWLTDEVEEAKAEASAFPDKTIRDAVLSALGLPFVVSYLDPCAMIEGPHGPLLQPKTDYARRKLEEHKGLLKSLGLYGLRMKS